MNAHPAADVLTRFALLKMWMRFRNSFRARTTDLSRIFLLAKFPDNLESLAQLSRASFTTMCRWTDVRTNWQQPIKLHARQLLQHFSDSDIDSPLQWLRRKIITWRIKATGLAWCFLGAYWLNFKNRSHPQFYRIARRQQTRTFWTHVNLVPSYRIVYGSELGPYKRLELLVYTLNCTLNFFCLLSLGLPALPSAVGWRWVCH